MKSKISRFLTASLIAVVILCISIFTFLANYMNKLSSDTIDEVGRTYMAGMNERIARHFETTIDLRLSQISALEKDIPTGSLDDEKLRQDLSYSAKVRDFDSLAFYFDDGTFDMLYGGTVMPISPDSFLDSMKKGENRVSVGTDEDGNRVVLLGVPGYFELQGEKKCIALLAEISVDYILDTLSLDEEDSLITSFLIRKDGSFVIRQFEQYHDNYFERMKSLYRPVDGRDVEEYIKEFQAAMSQGKSYSGEFEMDGERNQLFCSSLPGCQWYLITIMPYGMLNASVDNLSRQCGYMALGSCGVILLALLLIFARYFQMSKEQMQALEESRKLAEHASKSKSEFLSNMSHDIRTPMNAIVGMTAIAVANMDNPQQVNNCLKKITLSSRHLLGLINDVLDMSKIESGKMTLNEELVSLREVMDSIVSIVQPQIKSKRQHFNIFIHDISAEDVCCDGVRLNQVILNLISNAVKFTPEEGDIRVAMYEEPSPKGNDYIRIHFHVKDNGIGMSEEFQSEIFESFTREDRKRVHKTEGTGLGMAITKYIVDAMGGSIEVKSKQGEGTEFHIILDFKIATEKEKDMHLPNCDMLVVDDNKQLCESVVQSLESIGISAEWTMDGESAIRMAHERHQGNEDYQFILLDWKLPGMDGIDTAKEMRKQLGDNVPILLISAYDWGEIEQEARNAGITGFISKPLFKSTLYYGLKPYTETIQSETEEEEENIVNPHLEGKRILLAEDNELNWEVASELLQELGLILDWAENGKICVDKFKESAPGFYSAVLMDIRMPVMNGYEATMAIRSMEREDSHIPIIAMTADAFSEDVKRCLDCGMNAHAAKPIDIKEIARLLEKYFTGQL